MRGQLTTNIGENGAVEASGHTRSSPLVTDGTELREGEQSTEDKIAAFLEGVIPATTGENSPAAALVQVSPLNPGKSIPRPRGREARA